MVDRDTQRLFSIIGSIYDAALDMSLWSQALAQVRTFVEGEEASLFWKGAAGQRGDLFFDTGRMDRRYLQLYFEKYIKFDPLTTFHYFAEIDKPVSLADFADPDEFRESRFFKEWVQPQGYSDFIAAAIDRSNASVAMFGVFLHQRQGLASDETRRRMSLIAPHMRRAVLIGRTIDLKAAEAASMADTFDGLAAGVLMLDETGRILHANNSADQFLASGHVMQSVNGRLLVRDAAAAAELQTALAATSRGDSTLGSKGISIPITTADGKRYVGHVLPLVAGRRKTAGIGYPATAALFVREAGSNRVSSPELIAKAFSLTPAELRVFLAIVDVGGVPDVAESLGISQPTVKTHLQRIFAKTGTWRQADLVKLTAQFANPVER